MADFSPTRLDPDDATTLPQPPLSRAAAWASLRLDLGDGPQIYTRELNVMPQWAGSCWYELRYVDPTNTESFCDPANEAYWLGKQPDRADDPGGVDLYVGGVEHAVLHLLYARFWHKVLYDLGYVSSEEPFRRLVNQGYIQAYAYVDERGVYVPAEDVVEDPPGTFSYQDRPVRREYGKMGKSLNNVVTPDEMCESYGADVFRVYEMSMGPLEVSRPWQTRDVVGAQRFLQRLWRLVIDEQTGATVITEDAPVPAVEQLLQRTIDAVRQDYQQLSYHTAIAKLITVDQPAGQVRWRRSALGGRAAGADDRSPGPAHLRGALAAPRPRHLAGSWTVPRRRSGQAVDRGDQLSGAGPGQGPGQDRGAG